MDRFFHPRSVVIFGASTTPSKGGAQVLKNLLQYMKYQKYPDFFLIHPTANCIEDIQCYKDLNALPPNANGTARIDLAIIVLPVNHVMPAVRACIQKNVRGILIESGGLSNDDAESDKFGKEIKQLLKGHDIRLVGPNSIGFNVPALHYCTPIKYYLEFLTTRTNGRNMSLIAQSGLFITGFIECYFTSVQQGQPFGIAKMAAIGNKLDINECDLLSFYLEDPETQVIGMYLEDVREGKRFLTLLRANYEKYHKPIVLLKSGQSEIGKKAISSHTGSLAGNYTTIQAIARQYKIMLVDSFDDFFGLVTIACAFPLMRGKRIGAISISGAGCVFAADCATRYGLELTDVTPELRSVLRQYYPDWAPVHNPLDTWASIERIGPQNSFNSLIQAFLDSNQFDAVVVSTISSAFASLDWAYMAKAIQKVPNVPLVLHFFGGEAFLKHTRDARDHDLVVLPSYEQIFRLLRIFWDYSRKNGVQ